MRTSYRTVAATGLVALCATGVSALSASSATAAPPTIPLDSCNTTVQAKAGDSLSVTAKTVLAPQLGALRATPVVGPPAADALSAALSSMTLGAFPVTESPGTIGGADIAQKAAAAIPDEIPYAPDVRNLVIAAVAPNCGITITAAPDAPAANQPAASVGSNAPALAAPDAGPTPVAAETPSAPSYGHVPAPDYSNVTSIPPGGAGFDVGVAPTLAPMPLTGYGLPPSADTAPTQAPNLGLLKAPSAAPTAPIVPTDSSSATQSADVQPVVSEVTALPVAAADSNRVPAAAVVAALLLSLTTAALVRTWVLRRSVH